ncbi:MAG: hypothetical protein U0Q16_09000 [Bryobacteraceae bacterium]
MSQDVDAALKPIAEFEKTKDANLLEQASGRLLAIDPLGVPATADRLAVRHKAAAAWMRLIHAIDSARDPHFDPEDRPLTRTILPGSASPGGPPKDPARKAEYDKAVAANQRKAEQTQLQWRLKAIESEVSDGARSFFKRFFTPSPVDAKEVRQLREAAKIPEARWTEIMKPPAPKQ